MAASITSNGKRRDPTSTPPRSPAAVDTMFARSGGAQSPSFPSPKSPHVLVANRLSNLSIQGSTIPQTPEHSPTARTRFPDELVELTGEDRPQVTMSDFGRKLEDHEVESVESPPGAEAMDITPPLDPQYISHLAQHISAAPSSFSGMNHKSSTSSNVIPSRVTLRHPHHHHRKRSTHSLRTSPPHHPLSPISRNKHQHIKTASSIRRSHSPVPANIVSERRRPQSPPSSTIMSNPPTVPPDFADPPTLEMLDPDDDGYGINGIGYKPTPQMAYARTQKRKQQIMEWRAREAREARQRRSERRGVGIAREIHGKQMDETVDGSRIVRFA